MATKKASPRKAANKVASPAISRKEELRWQAQDDLRTLQRAEEIRTNTARMKSAQAEAKAQMQVLAKVGK